MGNEVRFVRIGDQWINPAHVVRVYQTPSDILTTATGRTGIQLVTGIIIVTEIEPSVVTGLLTSSPVADTRRLVECWNACEGLENPGALPEVLRAAEFAVSATAHLRELLPAYEYAELQANAEIVREAIAKLKGGA